MHAAMSLLFYCYSSKIVNVYNIIIHIYFSFVLSLFIMLLCAYVSKYLKSKITNILKLHPISYVWLIFVSEISMTLIPGLDYKASIKIKTARGTARPLYNLRVYSSEKLTIPCFRKSINEFKHIFLLYHTSCDPYLVKT